MREHAENPDDASGFDSRRLHNDRDDMRDLRSRGVHRAPFRRKDLIAVLVLAAAFLIAACLDDPRELAELDGTSESCEPDAISGASHRDGCTYSLARSSCNELQCCRLKTCCVTINGQRICQTTRADCVPVLQEINP